MVEITFDDTFCKLEEVQETGKRFGVKLKLILYDDDARDLPIGDLILLVHPNDMDDFKKKIDIYMEE